MVLCVFIQNKRKEKKKGVPAKPGVTCGGKKCNKAEDDEDEEIEAAPVAEEIAAE